MRIPLPWRSGNGAARPELPSLAYPLYPPPRVAVLGVDLAAEFDVRSFPRWSVCELEAFQPEALAGNMAELTTVARLRRHGQMALRCLKYPIVVLTQAGEAPLDAARHEDLWNWFGLPVFEQIRDRQGNLIAYECEARAGFHLAPGVVLDAAMSGLRWFSGATRERCHCGVATTRLLPHTVQEPAAISARAVG
jgi:hypothetical protein